MDELRTRRLPAQRGTPTRRDFLLGSLSVAAVASGVASGVGCHGSPPAAAPRPAASAGEAPAAAPRQLGVALLGLGNYARTQLAPSLQQTQHCKLRGIVTGTPDKVPNWQREFGIPDANVYDYRSFPRIADNREIDVVYVVTPTALHAKYAIMAAEAGKHVFCEKPMAMTVAECQSMIDACRANHVQLAIGYRMHHEPNTQTVMQMARDQPYGAITKVSALVGDRSKGGEGWRTERSMGGGALYDMGVYSINALRYASGEEPMRVLSARQWQERPELWHDCDEITEFELQLSSGLVAHGRASRFDDVNELRVEAQRGWYELSPMQAYTGVQGQTSDGKLLDQKIDRQQARQMDDDALAILEQRPLMTPGEEGLRDIQVIEAILACAQQKQPITIKLH